MEVEISAVGGHYVTLTIKDLRQWSGVYRSQGAQDDLYRIGEGELSSLRRFFATRSLFIVVIARDRHGESFSFECRVRRYARSFFHQFAVGRVSHGGGGIKLFRVRCLVSAFSQCVQAEVVVSVVGVNGLSGLGLAIFIGLGDLLLYVYGLGTSRRSDRRWVGSFRKFSCLNVGGKKYIGVCRE